jgi:hypothetical protein
MPFFYLAQSSEVLGVGKGGVRIRRFRVRVGTQNNHFGTRIGILGKTNRRRTDRYAKFPSSSPLFSQVRGVQKKKTRDAMKTKGQRHAAETMNDKDKSQRKGTRHGTDKGQAIDKHTAEKGRLAAKNPSAAWNKKSVGGFTSENLKVRV